MIKISPSILASDFANLETEIHAMQDARADMLHIDVMDGHFVPNITIGLPVVASLRKKSPMVFDVHLMVSDPLRYAPEFAKAGADIITFHVESDSDVSAVIKAIKQTGKKAGLSVKPATPAEAVFPYLDQLDIVLVMTVEPGFGGQSFMADMCPKIAAIRAECDRLGLATDIQVDGGIDVHTAPLVCEAGANVLVAGSALFSQKDYTAAVAELRHSAEIRG